MSSAPPLARPLFFALLLANLALFAWMQHAPPGDGREPHRLATQIEPDQVRILPPGSTRTTPVSPPASLCRSFSGIPAAAAREIETDLAATAPSLKLHMPQGKSSYWVFIPPLTSKAAADKKLAELRKLGVADAHLMQDKGPQQFAISLGLFRNEALASTYLEALGKKGVRSAKMEIQERSSISDQERIEIEVSGEADVIRRIEQKYPQLADTVSGECKAP